MKKCFALLPLFLVLACQDSGVGPDNPPNLRALSAVEEQVVASTNDFAFNLFRNLPGNSENTFISPLSVSMALAMVLNGAEGEVRQSILNTIDYKDFTADEVNEAYKNLTKLLLTMDNKVTMGIANSVWYDQQFQINPTFSSIIREYYDGLVKELDFKNASSKDVINNWVEDKTNQRIKNLIDQINPDEIMFLVNAIYFKGDWTYRFDKTKTKQAPFTTLNGTSTSVDMMFSGGVKMNYVQTGTGLLVDIPYGNGQFSFTVLMPHDYSDLPNLVDQLDAETLTQWLDQSNTIEAELELPRFKMTWKENLKETLSNLGMLMVGFSLLFEDETPPLEISRVIHQTFLEVNEEGTEAAAATAVGIQPTSMPVTPQKISIDKPFMFMLREKHSGVILFVGQLTHPGTL
jgi:serine protease inhibitor